MITEENCESCIYYPPSSFGGKPCSTCNPEDPICSCYQRRVEIPPTNADCIRAMSDEELAGIFCRAETDGRAYGPSGKAYLLDWLKSPTGGEQ